MNRTSMNVRDSVIYVICILVIYMFYGCATMSPMALNHQTNALQMTGKSIALFTLRATNQYKPSFRPSVTSVSVSQKGSEEGQKFEVEKPCTETDEYFEYIISLDLEPGTYSIGDVMGKSMKLPLILASFQFPIDAQFILAPNTIAYLGHVEMVNRERKEGEKRSGSVIPLVDQAVAGYSGGTFDITIIDRSDSDIPMIVNTYPVLQKHTVITALMINNPAKE